MCNSGQPWCRYGCMMYEVKHAQVSNCNQHNLRQDLPPDQLHHQLLPPRLHSHDIWQLHHRCSGEYIWVYSWYPSSHIPYNAGGLQDEESEGVGHQGSPWVRQPEAAVISSHGNRGHRDVIMMKWWWEHSPSGCVPGLLLRTGPAQSGLRQVQVDPRGAEAVSQRSHPPGGHQDGSQGDEGRGLHKEGC